MLDSYKNQSPWTIHGGGGSGGYEHESEKLSKQTRVFAHINTDMQLLNKKWF